VTITRTLQQAAWLGRLHADLEGLAQSLDRRACELEELIEKQHAVVGERDLAGGVLSPPIRAAVEIMWCRARNGRVLIRP